MNISFDIDGTLTEYPSNWLEFLYIQTGQRFLDTQFAKQQLGLDKYQEIKHVYRESDFKFEQAILPQMKILNAELHQSGFSIHFNSSRPFADYPSMLSRTETWLSRNGMIFDSVGTKSPERLKSQAVRVHIDDEIAEVNRLLSNGLAIEYCLVGSNSSDNDIINIGNSTTKLHFAKDPMEILSIVANLDIS